MRAGPLFLVLGSMIALALACGGGENPNQQGAGSREGGVSLAVGDIAVSVDGSYVVFALDEGLAVGWTATGAIQRLDVESPSRLAFANTTRTIFVGQELEGNVVAVDVETGAILWEADADQTGKDVFRIDISEDDLVLAVHDDSGLRFLDPASGALLYQTTTEQKIVDVDLLDGRAIMVEAELWEDELPSSQLSVIDTRTWQSRSFNVPNCAATLSLMPLAGRAFMAPTLCAQDPISVISLEEGAEGFERNLPGFGPVAVASDGWTAVGFYSVEDADESLFEDPSQMPSEDSANYHLMIIDGADLAYRFVEYGDTLPRYTIAPDGQVILVDAAYGDEGTVLLDMASGTYRTVEGAVLYLDNYALSADASTAYVLHPATWYDNPGLYLLDLVSATARQLPTDFVPTNFNLSPDDATLFLRESGSRVCVYALSDERCAAWFDTGELTGA